MKTTIGEQVIALGVIVAGICILKWYIVPTLIGGALYGLLGAVIAIKGVVSCPSQQEYDAIIASIWYGLITFTGWSIFAAYVDSWLSIILMVVGTAGAVFMGRYTYIERTCAPSQ